ncbi:MAG: hypothetical protein Q8R96_19390 [Bacteroidota bacterium]|nr:hypothetical protein [Bacteroidota bacterium]
MKKFLFKSLSVSLALLLLNMQSFAFNLKSTVDFTSTEIEATTDFNDSEIYEAFADISTLDHYLQTNEDKTYSDLELEDSSMLAGVSSTTTLPLSSSASDELALGIPSFLWGCVFGIVGVLVVYLMTDENKDQTKKAFFGCIAGSLIGTVLYVVVFAAAATTATTTY